MKCVGGHGANATGRLEPSVSRHQISVISSNRLWQIAALTLVGTISLAAHADAAVFWSDDDGGYSRPMPVAQPRAQRPPHRRQAKPVEAAAKEATKPQGPLIIAISISHQSLKVYDANGFFAETPISTGMAGHSTPMGAFSVIQKQKMHRSNIYSGAPMPFMQRITWSGIAMHAGVLPGYPASHGCIRMPMPFAVKMYGWTRMGARVVVTPGELTPASFSHPLLATQRVAPQPVAADAPKAGVVTDVVKADVIKADTAAKGDKAAAADPVSKPEMTIASLDLRSTVGHDSRAPHVMDEASTRKPLSEQTHTADAGTSPEANVGLAISDASASPLADNAAPERPAGTTTKSVKSVAELLASKRSETVASNQEPVAPNAVGAKATDDAQASPAVAKADDVKAQAVIVASPDKPGADVPAAANPPVPDASKDQARPSDLDKAETPKPAPTLAITKGNGPISVFISRKDAKLYVRQNFAPLFDVPVTITPSDRPLGTHIFTAEADKNDSNVLRWSVVTLPSSRIAEGRDDDERASRRRKIAGAAEIAKPAPVPDSPAEALDRLTIPADTMARITEAFSTGGSIIVSDQGIAAGETGEGTDFIVSLR
jgi:hypothetical protein